jgi:O-antigen ligase
MAIFWIFEGNWQEKWNRLKHSRLAIVFISFFLVNLIGFAYTSNIAEGLSILRRLLPLLAFPLILSTIPVLDSTRVERIFGWFILSCALATTISIARALQHYGKTGETEQFYYQQIAGLGGLEAIYFSIYTGFCVMLLVWLLLMRGRRMNHVLLATVVLLTMEFMVVLLLLSIRTAIGSLVLLGLFGFTTYYIRKGNVLKGVLLSVLLVVVTVIVILATPMIRQKFTEAFSFKDSIPLNQNTDQSLGRNWGGRALRVAIWQCAWDVVREHPLVGVGLGDVQDALQDSYRKNNFLFAADYNRYNAHNQFIETQLGTGLFGLLTLIAVFFLPAAYAFKQNKYLYVFFIFFILMNCLTESVFLRQKGVIFYAMFNALFAFHYLSKKNIR